MQNTDYVELYRHKVITKEIIVSKKIKQALQRHMNDLERDDLIYDTTEPTKVIKFIETMNDPKTNKPLKLTIFQKFIICLIYGWRWKKTNYRRFTKVFLSMARKNGKSLLISGIALYELIMSRTKATNREIFLCANSTAQASLLLSMMKDFVEQVRKQSKFIKQATKIVRNEIRFLRDNSYARVVSSDTSKLDGFECNCAVLDEWHEAANENMLNVMRSSQTQLFEPLIIIITTVGFNLNYPLFTIEYPFATSVLNGDIEADNYLALIWELDNEKEIHSSKNWIKANPILEVEKLRPTVMDFLTTEIKAAQAKRDLSAVLVKNFNVWQNANAKTFIHYPDWIKNTLETPPEIKEKEIYIGVDLAYTNDLAAITWAIPMKEEKYFYVDSHVFVVDPIEREKRDKINYSSLIREGKATACEMFIDTTAVAEYILNMIESNSLECKGIFYDPAHGADFRNYLIREGYDNYLTIVRQGVLTLSPASLQLREDILKGKVKHYQAYSLNLGVKNAIEKRVNDAVIIDKSKARDKIDALDALINIWTEAPNYQFEPLFYDVEEIGF